MSSSGAAGKNAGKYGLGLTLSLLYSQKHFGGFLKVSLVVGLSWLALRDEEISHRNRESQE